MGHTEPDLGRGGLRAGNLPANRGGAPCGGPRAVSTAALLPQPQEVLLQSLNK